MNAASDLLFGRNIFGYIVWRAGYHTKLMYDVQFCGSAVCVYMLVYSAMSGCHLRIELKAIIYLWQRGIRSSAVFSVRRSEHFCYYRFQIMNDPF